jgi:Aspartyl protease
MRFLVLGVVASSRIAAAEELPVLPASSVFVDVADGDEVFREEWIVGSGTEAAPQVYIPIRSDQPKPITFTADRGKVTFDTLPGQAYTFIVERDGARIFTRIDRSSRERPTLKHGLVATRSSAATAPVAIPFSIDESHGIRIRGSINGSPLLELAFDTGAKRVYVVKERLAGKAALTFGARISDVGSDGISQAAVSTGNTLVIGDLAWEGVDLVESPIGDTDGIIGWSVFENKLVEIDYDRKVMVIHDSLATVPAGYTKLPLRTYSGSPFVEATATIQGREITDWFLFDSGFNKSLYVSNRLAARHGLAGDGKGGTMASSAQKPIVVQHLVVSNLRIGTFDVANINASVNVGGPEEVPHNDILGNELLSQFNVVLDIQHEALYLRRRAPATRSRGCGRCATSGAAPGDTTLVLVVLVAAMVVRRRTPARRR